MYTRLSYTLRKIWKTLTLRWRLESIHNTSRISPILMGANDHRVLKKIKSGVIESEPFMKVIFEIREFIMLCWLPGHINLEENKVIDELAQGCSQSIDLPIDETV